MTKKWGGHLGIRISKVATNPNDEYSKSETTLEFDGKRFAPSNRRFCPCFGFRILDFELVLSFFLRHFLQVLLHNVFLIRTLVGFFCADQATLVEIDQCVIHQTHALFFPGLNDAG
jgi:hypothetical protein